MPKLSHALAASALLVALAAPSFAADIDSSASQRNSATIQNRSGADAGVSAGVNTGVNAGVNTRSGTSTQTNDRDDLNGSASLNSKATQDHDRTVNRPQSAQVPTRDQDRDRDQDMNGPGRSSMSPGHEMQEDGSVPGSPGASGYAPGHR